MGEFALIDAYFKSNNMRDDIVLGIGDDAAIINPPTNCNIVITTDTLVANTHFLPNAPAELVAHKALTANLSDLAAMGATPAWISLALTMPTTNHKWLQGFSKGLFNCAKEHNLDLIGGDTTKGPLSITITLHGFIKQGCGLTRAGAKIGDDIYITGPLGMVGAGLELILQEKEQPTPNDVFLIERHFKSSAQVKIGQKLLYLANSAIDISDGLIADLSHILQASNCGAKIILDNITLSPELLKFCNNNKKQAQQLALTSGEEYHLCFTAKRCNRELITNLSTEITRIGTISTNKNLQLVNNSQDLQPVDWDLSGYEHFK